jgi:hypothetical protein
MTQKQGIVILILLIAIAGAITGYRYYHYINDEPAFCSLCHLTEEGYTSWERSGHSFLKCQACHKISIIEGNRLLLAYVSGNTKIKQSHGREQPWASCRGCHDTEAAQGSITFRKSYGHARHVFMLGMSCNQCHGIGLHNLKADSSKCLKCHSDKLVHGMGTAGLECLNCHAFTESGPKMTSSKRCFKCHSGIPRKGPMSKIECFECHRPHTKLKIESSECLGRCHSNEVNVGQHRLHMVKKKLQCLDCHKPHTWTVTKENAKGLCDRCHKMKDPLTFIY